MTIVVTSTVTEGQLAYLRSQIQAKGYSLDTAPEVQNAALNSVYRKLIGMRRWPFLEVVRNTDITCSVGQDNYNLAVIGDLLHVDAVRAEIGDEVVHLEHVPVQQFRTKQHLQRTPGQPSMWTKVNGYIHLWRAPDREYTLSIDYTRRPAELVGDDDATILPSTYQDVLVWGAVAELCFRERDMTGYEMAKAEFGSRLIDMMNEYGVRQRQNSSQVADSGTWDYLEVDEDEFLWPVS